MDNTCIDGNERMIRQLTDLLERIPPDIYCAPLALFNGSSLGQHFRHIVDFYRCMARGIPEQKIDYTARERDLRTETQPRYAADLLTECLEQLRPADMSLCVRVATDFIGQLPKERIFVDSTVGRELMFAHDHAVHHLAMIRMGLQQTAPEVRLDDAVGYAAATVSYRQLSGTR